MTRPWPFGFTERIPTKMESSETSEVFIRSKKVQYRKKKKKKYSTCGWTHGQTQRVVPSCQFKSLVWSLSFRFSLVNHFDCLVLSLFLVYLWILPCVCVHGFHHRDLWVDEHYSPFDLQGTWLKEWETCGLYILSGQDLASFIILLCPQGMNSSCSVWGQFISCLKAIFWKLRFKWTTLAIHS